jgi:hypothetical protein
MLNSQVGPGRLIQAEAITIDRNQHPQDALTPEMN